MQHRDDDLALANSMAPEIKRQIEAMFAKVWPDSNGAYEYVLLKGGATHVVRMVPFEPTRAVTFAPGAEGVRTHENPFDAARALVDAVAYEVRAAGDGVGIMWRMAPSLDFAGRVPRWKATCFLGIVPANAEYMLEPAA